MPWLTDSLPSVVETVVRTALIFFGAVVLLRLARRRTIAQWTVTDVVTAVSVGAVVGRTAVADSESVVTGVVALATLVTAHALVIQARRFRWFRRLTEHQVRVLVVQGRFRSGELRSCGLTEDDVREQMRLRGVRDLAAVRYVLFERQGGLTVVPDSDAAREPLIDLALDGARNWDRGTGSQQPRG